MNGQQKIDGDAEGVARISNRPLLAFVHIEKAAGTSLIHILRRAFFLRYFDVSPVYPGPHKFLKARDLSTLLRLYPWTRCIGGHSVVPFSDLDTGFPNIRYITLFREPSARYVSQYIYWRDKLGRRIPFEDYLERADARNVQTKRIVGRAHADQAIQTLQERFALVGTVEKFSDFLHALERMTGRAQLASAARRRNVSSRTEEALEIRERYRDRIIEVNSADIRVYDFVQDHLMPQVDDTASPSQADGGAQTRGRDWRLAVDYLIRKIWLQPAVGLVRRSNGLTRRGVYGQVRGPG